MPVFWLTEDELSFPHPELANDDGILAVGGDLSVERLLLAYKIGLFPWFNPDDPILWWSPNPRFVLFPDELKISKSMRPYFNQKKFDFSFDQDFDGVMRACQTQGRKGQTGGTWISEHMIESYSNLFRLGFAHSIEVWKEGELVGGLYGVAIGKCFYGESMFARVSNASKFGFIALVQHLKKWGYWLVDCQQQTRHLETLGARSIPRKDFLKFMKDNTKESTTNGTWEELLDEKLIWNHL